MAAAGAALLAGGRIAQGVSAYQQGRGTAEAAMVGAEYQYQTGMDTADFYERLGEFNAEAAITQARAEAGRYRRQAGRKVSGLRAKFASRGVQLAGSPLDVLADEVMAAEHEAQLIEYGGEVTAQRARLEAQARSRAEQIAAHQARYGGQVTAESARRQGMASLLAAGGQAGSSLIGGMNA